MNRFIRYLLIINILLMFCSWNVHAIGQKQINNLFAAKTLNARPEFIEFNLDEWIYHAGFFAVFVMVLGFLQEYEEGKYAGYNIDFKNIGLYYDPIYGVNWWGYYFEKTSYISKKKAVKKVIPGLEIKKLGEKIEFKTTR